MTLPSRIPGRWSVRLDNGHVLYGVIVTVPTDREAARTLLMTGRTLGPNTIELYAPGYGPWFVPADRLAEAVFLGPRSGGTETLEVSA